MAVSQNGGSSSGPPKLMADINVTPMVDVMLVLLVIFMVTAPLLVAGVRVDLPKTNAAKLTAQQKPLVVTLAADGEVYLGGDLLPRPELEGRLAALRGNQGDDLIAVNADRKIPYGEVLLVLGDVQKAGFKRISLLSQAIDKAPPLSESGAKAP